MITIVIAYLFATSAVEKSALKGNLSVESWAFLEIVATVIAFFAIMQSI